MSFIAVLPALLLLALALVMFGLGLSLSMADFQRLLQYPRAAVIALLLQTVLLPGACYALAKVLGLPPVLAVGMLLLAASPGGVTANIFSHLFGGNVALNISLTAINTVLSVVTLPLIVNLAIAAFTNGSQVVPLQFGKMVEVIAVILLPVAAGMVVAARSSSLAGRLERPFKIFSVLVLAVLVLVAAAKEWQTLGRALESVGPAVLIFNVLSLAAGYACSRAAGLDRTLATAISFEIGVHNATLALYIALSVLNNGLLALPAALYSIVMYFTAIGFGLLLRRQRQPLPAVA